MIAPNRPLRVLGIAGSLRAESVSTQALTFALDLMAEQGCRVELFDPRRSPLPFCNGDKSYPWHEAPAVAELRRKASAAEAILLATPEYHGAVSGVLKNALDLLDFPHLEGKVAAAISVLGGRHNSNALNQLRTICRWCRMTMVAEQVAVAKARSAFADRRPRDPELVTRLQDLALSLVRTTRALRAPGEVDTTWVAVEGASLQPQAME